MSESRGTGEVQGGEVTVRFLYAKQGISRFISSRYMAVVLERALRRIGFPLVFTQGFHPRPRMRFGPSLPVGIAGSNEFFDLRVAGRVDPEAAVEAANRCLPPGLRMVSCRLLPPDGDRYPTGLKGRYRIERTASLDEAALARTGRIVESSEHFVTIEVVLDRFNHTALLNAAGGALIERVLVYDKESAG